MTCTRETHSLDAVLTICGRTEDKLVQAVAAIEPRVGEGGSIRHVVADITVEEQLAAAEGGEDLGDADRQQDFGA